MALLEIDRDLCIGCEACVEACAFGALSLDENEIAVVNDNCTACGACVDECPTEALRLPGAETPAVITTDLDAYQGGQLLPGFVFSRPVTITVQYSDSDVQGINEGSLRLYYWMGNVWEDVINTCTPPSTYTRDLNQNVLGVPICHLSRIGVRGPTLESIYLPLVLRNS